jgi:hypothetical protein
MVLTALEIIGFIAMRPRDLDKNAFLGQSLITQILNLRNLAPALQGGAAIAKERMLTA